MNAVTCGRRAVNPRGFTSVPFVDGGLFPPCPIPGCAGITQAEGQPCQACQELFGDYLTRNRCGGRSMTSVQVGEHKAATLEAYRRMHATPAPAPALGQPERRGNQRCWICEERHTCTQVPHPGLGWAWECDQCREVTR